MPCRQKEHFPWIDGKTTKDNVFFTLDELLIYVIVIVWNEYMIIYVCVEIQCISFFINEVLLLKVIIITSWMFLDNNVIKWMSTNYEVLFIFLYNSIWTLSVTDKWPLRFKQGQNLHQIRLCSNQAINYHTK